MKRLVLVIITGLVFAAVAIIAGCTTKGTESTPKLTGDTTSSQFKTASTVFDSALNVGMGQFVGAIDMAGLAASASGAPNGSSRNSAVVFTPVYHEASKYWYLNRSGMEYVYAPSNHDSIIDSVEWTAIDSLQFRQGDSAVFKPDSASWNELRVGCSFAAQSQTKDDSLNSGRVFVVVGAPGALWARGDVIINGAGGTNALLTDLHPHDDTSTICEIQVTLAGVWASVHANLDDVASGVACPTSGMISENGTMVVGCVKGPDSVSFHGTWSGSLAYMNGLVTATYESPSTRWTVTRPCPGSQPVMASRMFRLK